MSNTGRAVQHMKLSSVQGILAQVNTVNGYHESTTVDSVGDSFQTLPHTSRNAKLDHIHDVRILMSEFSKSRQARDPHHAP